MWTMGFLKVRLPELPHQKFIREFNEEISKIEPLIIGLTSELLKLMPGTTEDMKMRVFHALFKEVFDLYGLKYVQTVAKNLILEKEWFMQTERVKGAMYMTSDKIALSKKLSRILIQNKAKNLFYGSDLASAWKTILAPAFRPPSLIKKDIWGESDVPVELWEEILPWATKEAIGKVITDGYKELTAEFASDEIMHSCFAPEQASRWIPFLGNLMLTNFRVTSFGIMPGNSLFTFKVSYYELLGFIIRTIKSKPGLKGEIICNRVFGEFLITKLAKKSIFVMYTHQKKTFKEILEELTKDTL